MPNYRSDQIRRGELFGWHVYLLADGESFCKIGSATNIAYRLTALQTGNPRKLKLVKSWHLIDREAAKKAERKALELAQDRRIPNSEWVRCSRDFGIDLVEVAIGLVGAQIRYAA